MATTKKTIEKKEKPLIKYEYKSAGQPELVLVFNEMKKLLLPYEKGNLKVYGGDGGQMHLISKKEVMVLGKPRSEMWFASLLIQKGYVGFYFMPISGDKSIQNNLSESFMKCLKGKSCFHIKELNPAVIKDIKKALYSGYKSYKTKEWI